MMGFSVPLSIVVLAWLTRVVAVSDCQSQVSDAATALEDVGSKIYNAAADCVEVSLAKCEDELTGISKELSVVSEDLKKAVSDCGLDGTPCAADVTALVDATAKVTAAITQGLVDCIPGSPMVTSRGPAGCINDVMLGVKAIMGTASSAAKVRADCSPVSLDVNVAVLV